MSSKEEDKYNKRKDQFPVLTRIEELFEQNLSIEELEEFFCFIDSLQFGAYDFFGFMLENRKNRK